MEKYINRTLEKKVLSTSEAFPVVMITGPRQVGKTTLLEYISKKYDKKINYVSLDDMKVRALAVTDPEQFLEMYECPLIIDEFQYAPNILSYIKMKVDKMRLDVLDSDIHIVGEYYLTGSSVFETMKDVSESLAGRVGILDLYGLSSREISGKDAEIFIPSIDILKRKELDDQLTTKELFDRIIKGSYPEVHSNPHIEYEQFYEIYIRTYIERDVRKLINIKDEIKFLKFVSSLAARTGTELVLNDLCDDVDITNNTAESWLSILVNTGLVFLLQPYSNKALSRIVKRPKIYFIDTGLACYLAGYVDSRTLERSAYSGAIFETYIVSEIIKSYAVAGKNPKRYLYYYRDNNGKEIDLLIIYNNTVYPLEIKKNSNPNKTSIKNFEVASKFGLEVGNGGVICMSKDLFPLDKNNYLIPINYI